MGKTSRFTRAKPRWRHELTFIWFWNSSWRFCEKLCTIIRKNRMTLVKVFFFSGACLSINYRFGHRGTTLLAEIFPFRDARCFILYTYQITLSCRHNNLVVILRYTMREIFRVGEKVDNTLWRVKTFIPMITGFRGIAPVTISRSHHFKFPPRSRRDQAAPAPWGSSPRSFRDSCTLHDSKDITKETDITRQLVFVRRFLLASLWRFRIILSFFFLKIPIYYYIFCFSNCSSCVVLSYFDLSSVSLFRQISFWHFVSCILKSAWHK